MRRVILLSCICACNAVPQYDETPYQLSLDGGTMSGGVMAVPRGGWELVTVSIRDDKGVVAVVNPFEISWSMADTGIATVNGLGFSARVYCHQDFFDNAVAADGGVNDAGTVTAVLVGHEPETQLTVEYRGGSASVRVACVVNAEGSWHVEPDDGNDADFSLEQSGRTVRNRIYGLEGEIVGNRFSYSLLYYDVEGQFDSRNSASGTYVNNDKGTDGSWVGHKN